MMSSEMGKDLGALRVWLIGDDRERDYPVTYSGKANFPDWDYDGEGDIMGIVPVALIDIGEGRETLCALHPEYGWCLAYDEPCRDFDPPIDPERLRMAV